MFNPSAGQRLPMDYYPPQPRQLRPNGIGSGKFYHPRIPTYRPPNIPHPAAMRPSFTNPVYQLGQYGPSTPQMGGGQLPNHPPPASPTWFSGGGGRFGGGYPPVTDPNIDGAGFYHQLPQQQQQQMPGHGRMPMMAPQQYPPQQQQQIGHGRMPLKPSAENPWGDGMGPSPADDVVYPVPQAKLNSGSMNGEEDIASDSFMINYMRELNSMDPKSSKQQQQAMYSQQQPQAMMTNQQQNQPMQMTRMMMDQEQMQAGPRINGGVERGRGGGGRRGGDGSGHGNANQYQHAEISNLSRLNI